MKDKKKNRSELLGLFMNPLDHLFRTGVIILILSLLSLYLIFWGCGFMAPTVPTVPVDISLNSEGELVQVGAMVGKVISGTFRSTYSHLGNPFSDWYLSLDWTHSFLNNVIDMHPKFLQFTLKEVISSLYIDVEKSPQRLEVFTIPTIPSPYSTYVLMEHWHNLFIQVSHFNEAIYMRCYLNVSANVYEFMRVHQTIDLDDYTLMLGYLRSSFVIDMSKFLLDSYQEAFAALSDRPATWCLLSDSLDDYYELMRYHRSCMNVEWIPSEHLVNCMMSFKQQLQHHIDMAEGFTRFPPPVVTGEVLLAISKELGIAPDVLLEYTKMSVDFPTDNVITVKEWVGPKLHTKNINFHSMHKLSHCLAWDYRPNIINTPPDNPQDYLKHLDSSLKVILKSKKY